MSSLRLVFAGSPTAAVPSLEVLLASNHEIAAVVTRNDSRQGRKGILTATPVAEYAETHGVRVIKANRLDDETTEQIGALRPDLGVIVAYGGLVREPLLSVPKLGWINLHFSLLPRWRGAAPVQHAIIAGDEFTGTSVFQLVPDLDAGDLFAIERTPIEPGQDAGNLLDSLAVSGASVLRSVVDSLASGSAAAEPQHGEVTLAPKLTLVDGQLDFAEPASVIAKRVRGVTPEPGAFTVLGGSRLKILEVAVAHDVAAVEPGRFVGEGKRVLVGTSTEPLELLRVQPAGKTAMVAADWWRGRPTGAPSRAEGAQ